MIPLTLPFEDRRIILRSFWIAISLLFGTGLSLADWWLNVPFPFLSGLIAATCCASFVFVKETLIRRLYHAWNKRIVRPYAHLARDAVMRICFFVIFVSTRVAGSRFRPHDQATASWERRTSLPDEAFELPFALQGGANARTGWIRDYIAWAIRSDNAWSISLLPFLWVLRVLADENKKPFEANIYTLF